MTLQIGQQTITIHMLPNISRRKGNQAMQFGQFQKLVTQKTQLPSPFYCSPHPFKVAARLRKLGSSKFFKKG